MIMWEKVKCFCRDGGEARQGTLGVTQAVRHRVQTGASSQKRWGGGAMAGEDSAGDETYSQR